MPRARGFSVQALVEFEKSGRDNLGPPWTRSLFPPYPLPRTELISTAACLAWAGALTFRQAAQRSDFHADTEGSAEINGLRDRTENAGGKRCGCGSLQQARLNISRYQNRFHRNWLYTSWWYWTSGALTKVPSNLGQRSAAACLRSAYRVFTFSPRRSVVHFALRKFSMAS